jgi:hypothetical protein
MWHRRPCAKRPPSKVTSGDNRVTGSQLRGFNVRPDPMIAAALVEGGTETRAQQGAEHAGALAMRHQA